MGGTSETAGRTGNIGGALGTLFSLPLPPVPSLLASRWFGESCLTLEVGIRVPSAPCGYTLVTRSTWNSAIFCPELRQTDGQSGPLPPHLHFSHALFFSVRPSRRLWLLVKPESAGLLPSPQARELTLNSAQGEAGAQDLGRAPDSEAKGPLEPSCLHFSPSLVLTPARPAPLPARSGMCHVFF